jgi:phosphoglycerol transferase MdoB-like AlkP superfamily enzyme
MSTTEARQRNVRRLWIAVGAKAAAGTTKSHGQRLLADVGLWMGIVLLLQGFRAALLCSFHSQMGVEVSARQVMRCFATGLGFDAATATYLCLPVIVFSFAGFFLSLGRLHARVRQWVIGFNAIFLSLIFSTDIAYFHEYHNQFDAWIWGLVFDDRRAIALTIWKSYPVVWLTLGTGLLAGAMGWFLSRWTSWLAQRTGARVRFIGVPVRMAAGAVLVTAVVFGLRGSLGRRPAQLKDAAVCGDVFLDKLVLNPVSALRYAIKQRFTLLQAAGLETILPGGDIRAAAHAFNPQAKSTATIDDLVQRVASGAANRKPQHIFLVVMESYDAWPLEPKYEGLHLTDRLAALGRAGIKADAFVSAGAGTMPSLATLICGLPEVGLTSNYRASVRAGVSTAAAPIFKSLGYRTRLFYGGYPSWQRLGDFCREQGFDEVYGGAAMSDHLSGNEWGVDDRILFDVVLDRTGDEPTFNLIMTTSYHPPYSIDLAAEGFPLKQLPPELSSYHITADEWRIFGHLWYSDRCLGEFAATALSKQPASLLAITGDHWSRRSLDPRPTIFERRAVPLVLYGPAVLAHLSPPSQIVGSHNDILPTLIELAAPPGFAYHAFGRNLLDASLPQVGLGIQTVVTPNSIFEVDPPAGPESLSGQPLPSSERVKELELRHRQFHALAWWRIMKGNELPLPLTK